MRLLVLIIIAFTLLAIVEISIAKNTLQDDHSEPKWSVKIISEGKWGLTISGNSETILGTEGEGDKTFPITGDYWFISANARKKSEEGTLRVEILRDGMVAGYAETDIWLGYATATAHYAPT
jgi:hypothetical protein